MGITPLRRPALGCLLLTSTLLATACTTAQSQDRERVVLAVATGFTIRASHITPLDIVDVGVPGLHNLTRHSVRVQKVSLVATPPAVHLLSVTAHPGQPVGGLTGNLARLCRTSYPPYPVTDAVAPPLSDSNWFLVLAISFAKPGRYYLGRVKIYYTTGGQAGWQYQNLFTTVLVRSASPGYKPRFDGCP